MKNYRLLELAGMLNEDALLEADSNAASLYNAAVKSGKRASASQEAIIAKDPVAAYKYAKNVLKARWPAAEKSINMDARTAALYKRDVLREDNEDTRQKQILKESLGYSGKIPTDKDYFSVFFQSYGGIMGLVSDIVGNFGYTYIYSDDNGNFKGAFEMLKSVDDSLFVDVVIYSKRQLNDADIAKILKSMLVQGGDEFKADYEIG